MQATKRCSQAFKAISVEPSFNKNSLFFNSHVYIGPQAMKEMGLSWGQPVGVANLASERNQEIQSFVFLNQTLRKDEMVLGQEVATALGYKKNGIDMVLLQAVDT